MNIPLTERKIPTIVGLLGVLFLVIGLAFTSLGVGRVTKLFSAADVSFAPLGLQVANLTDSSAVIYWTTEKETVGAVNYGRSASLSEGTAIDDRNLTNRDAKFFTHLVTLSNLTPSTKYNFKVISGGSSYGDPANGEAAFEFSTGPSLPPGPAIDPRYGRVKNTFDAIVVWQSAGATRIATFVKPEGNEAGQFLLPLGKARRTDLSGNFSLTPGLAETITVITPGQTTTVLTCKVGAEQPLLEITPGKNSDCFQPATTVPTATPSANLQPSFPARSPAFPAPGSGNLDVNLSSGEAVSTSLPTISGSSGPNQIIKIIINSPSPVSGTVKADALGRWSWTPPTNLEPGSHTVTITVVNADGTTQTVTRKFIVTAGEPILPITSGTSSGQLTHLACVSRACTSVQGAGSDQCSVDSDCPEETPYETGALGSTLLVLTLGFLFFTLSSVVFFLAKENQHGSSN